MLASEKSKILSAKDLVHKRVNLGPVGSGTLQNAKDFLKIFNIKEEDIHASYLSHDEVLSGLSSKDTDAFFYTIGHPSSHIKYLTDRKKLLIIPAFGKHIEKFIDEFPYYSTAYIPKKFYPNIMNKDDEIKTIGVKAVMATSRYVDSDIVYAITKELFENFEEFKKSHPPFSTLRKEDLLKGLTLPIHSGALKYYKEAGLIRHIQYELRASPVKLGRWLFLIIGLLIGFQHIFSLFSRQPE